MEISLSDLKELLLSNVDQPAASGGALRIIVLQRGWVLIGRFFQEGTACRVEDAKCIRRWGTKSGLGQLAMKGPTADTILDEYGTVRVHELCIVAVIDCEEKLWSKYY